MRVYNKSQISGKKSKLWKSWKERKSSQQLSCERFHDKGEQGDSSMAEIWEHQEKEKSWKVLREQIGGERRHLGL